MPICGVNVPSKSSTCPESRESSLRTYYMFEYECDLIFNFWQLSAKPQTIGADLAGLLGGRMASVEDGSVPSGVGYGAQTPGDS